MSNNKFKYLLRYIFIIKSLQSNKLLHYKDIKQHLYRVFKERDVNFNYSLRTFQRDKKDIKELFGISIKFNKYEKKYFIDTSNHNDSANILLEAFSIIDAFRIHDKYQKHISFEQRNIGEQEFFSILNEAIKNRNKVEIHYEKYDKEQIYTHKIKPLAFKEFAGRWYLMAQTSDNKDMKYIRIFGLDRIHGVKRLPEKFIYPDFNIEEYFKDFYGIIADKRVALNEIILSFDAHQGKYIKSLPLHHSQEILVDNEDELRIKLKLRPTYDFKQKILSFGNRVAVIEPESLKDKIIDELKSSINWYEKYSK